MSQGFPSVTALLGLLAVAGYQNRDKIAEMLGGLQGQLQGGGATHPGGALPSGTGAPAGQGGAGRGGSPIENILAGLRGQNADPTSFIGGALGNLVDKFKQAGHGDVAQSWVDTGANRPIAPPDLERAIGADTLSTLQQQTGLSREEILSRLSRALPDAVDRYTPDGRLPSPA